MSFNRIPDAKSRQQEDINNGEYCHDRWNNENLNYKGKITPIIEVNRYRHKGKGKRQLIRLFYVIEDTVSENFTHHRIEKDNGQWKIMDSQKYIENF